MQEEKRQGPTSDDDSRDSLSHYPTGIIVRPGVVVDTRHVKTCQV